MTKVLLAIIAFSLSATTGVARDYLAETVARIADAPSLSTRFEASDPAGGKVTGDAVIAGRCFAIVTDGGEYETWFDGKTQWTYSAETGEVSMTEPTQQEILEVNPLAIVTGIDSAYGISAPVAGKDGRQTYRLTPADSSSGIKKASVTIDPATLLPVTIHATLSDNSTLTIHFTETKIGDKIPAKRFRYDPMIHPDAEIIDLR